MVFYRKYRPQKIEELDLASVREKLFSILKKGVPHAFLFTGPKGLGKTSAARILAKAINCEKNKGKKEIEPCNKCSACISITNGSNIDVLEIDAASNRGIDEIRNLREKIKFAPSSLPKKVYIIDEVHMLTTEAFNALLKTLEEPPEHALFILCTTEAWKLPATIVSRTFSIHFEKPTKEELERALKRVVKGENLTMEKGAIEAIYSISEGSFRDAVKVIEELSVSHKKITPDLLESFYKTGSIDREAQRLVGFLAEKNAKEALLILDKLAKAGADFKVLNEKIVEHLRHLLLKKAGFKEEIEDIEKLDILSLNLLITYFQESYRNLKFSVLPQLPLELVVIKWCLIEVESLKFKVESSEGDEKDQKEEKTVDNVEAKKSNKPSGFSQELIEAVKKENYSIAGVLRSCSIGCSGSNVEITTPYKFHQDKLNETKVKKIIEERASEILGKKVNLVIKSK